jgi:hypothetical protein
VTGRHDIHALLHQNTITIQAELIPDVTEKPNYYRTTDNLLTMEIGVWHHAQTSTSKSLNP